MKKTNFGKNSRGAKAPLALLAPPSMLFLPQHVPVSIAEYNNKKTWCKNWLFQLETRNSWALSSKSSIIISTIYSNKSFNSLKSC